MGHLGRTAFPVSAPQTPTSPLPVARELLEHHTRLPLPRVNESAWDRNHVSQVSKDSTNENVARASRPRVEDPPDSVVSRRRVSL